MTLGIPPGVGKNGLMDKTPMWWSMAAKRTLAKVDTKHVNTKSTGHDKKHFTVTLADMYTNDHIQEP